MRILLLFFILTPLAEMLLLFEVASHIGGLWAVGLVVLTAVLGIQILKRQGLRTLLRARRRVESGELPAKEIIEGMLLAAAGAMLLTPGFITDTLGFIFLTPPARAALAAWLIDRGIWVLQTKGRAAYQASTGSSDGSGGNSGRDSHRRSGAVYEGEYSRQSPESDRLGDSRGP